jgi:putative transcriptional regulator
MSARSTLVVLSALAVLTGATAGRSAETRPRIRSLAGELLVATAEMRDPRFAQTVIYMVRHDPNGALGLVVNRPAGEVPLAKLLEQMQIEAAGATGTVRLHRGGPVEGLRVFVLHTDDYRSDSTIAVKDDISLSVEPDILEAIAAGKGPRRRLVVLGYAGWAPGQLEAEIEAGAWVRASADEATLFDEDYDEKWKRALARHKIDL